MHPARLAIARTILIFSCAVLVLGQLSGAHVHLCFDGGGPRTSIHLTADAGDAPTQSGASGTHHDMDVSVANAVGKKAATDADLVPVLTAAIIVFGGDLMPRSRILPPSSDVVAPVSSLFELLPPLRGPPA